MIAWFFYLSLTHKILFGIAGLVVIFLYVFWLTTYTLNVHQQTKSPEHTISRIKFFNKPMNLLLLFLDFVLNFLLIWTELSQVLVDDPDVVVYISLLAAFVLFCLVTMVNQQISFNATQTIQGFTVTRKEKLGRTIRVQLMLFAFLLVVCFIAYGFVNRHYDDYGFTVLVILAGLCMGILTDLLSGKTTDVKPLEDQELGQHLQDYVKREGIRDVNFYTFSNQKREKANVIVTGFRTKRFFFAEDLFEDFTVKQLESVVIRGLSQIKQKHSLIHYAILLFSLLPLYGVASLINWYENANGVVVPGLITFGMYVICFVLYSCFLSPLIFRIMERRADQYVLDQGVDYRDFTIALLKIKELKDCPSKTKRSIARRVRWIVQKSGGSREEVEHYRKAEDDLSQ
ncbi:hypothetical protein [Tuberibacillus sp. Marseille-P3662]|uniref:hypothetical protein n=1 Tax=Tuberibacillus sp. Marseille-P3662 TaxID=1965358 RepID=UPI000A1CAC1C|nr:hypothetical protein [Tuberibacillus sp. Marseille-P3662]